MKYLILTTLFLVGCSDGRYYDHELPFLGAHTKEEWDEISRKNLESLACMDKLKNVHYEVAMKKCGLKEISRIVR